MGLVAEAEEAVLHLQPQGHAQLNARKAPCGLMAESCLLSCCEKISRVNALSFESLPFKGGSASSGGGEANDVPAVSQLE